MPINKNTVMHRGLTAILGIAIFLILLSEFILNLTPPTARDALIHHLAIPKLWLKNGGFYEMPWADFSYFPMNIDLLYMIPLYLQKDFLANFIHMGFGIATALLIYRYLNKRTGPISGLLGVLIFISTPIVFRLSTQAYVDLGLTFFSAASIFSFIRYRDGGFKEFKWLLFSSLSMGIALGTKYNALVIWFFLTLWIVLITVRDTKNQRQALWNGAIYFLISGILFSPWLIKNIMLTGNPLYPLFKESVSQMFSENAHTNFFSMREVLYEENLWETLTIPVRMFFQGQDNSPRYFDGVLNPVLILLAPFSLADKSFMRDKLFFISFASFFILTVFFLEGQAFGMDQIVRYALPVIPFLSILAAMGMIAVWKRIRAFPVPLRNILTALFFSMVVLFMSINYFYIKNYYQNINPGSYLWGKETRDEFISRHNSSYESIKYINTHTPENATIRLVFLAGRGYYLERKYSEGSVYGIGDMQSLVKAQDKRTFRNVLQSLDCTHLLIRTDLLEKYLNDNYPPHIRQTFFRRLGETMEVLYQKNSYMVLRIIPET
jgi:hypothetical protein